MVNNGDSEHSQKKGLNVFFDVDYTILGLDDSVRPGTRDVFQRLIADGHKIYIWSGVGIRWPDIRRVKLDDLIVNCYVKPLRDYAESLASHGVPFVPDFVIDDYPEVPSAFGGMWILPYYSAAFGDAEMEKVYRVITEFATTGTSTEKQFRRRGHQPPHDRTH